MTYDCKKSNTTGAINGTGAAYPSEAPEFTTCFIVVRAALSLVFCVVFCRSLFVLFFWPFLSVLIFTASDYLFGIFKLCLATYKSTDFKQIHSQFDIMIINRMGGFIVSVLSSSAVDTEFEPWSSQTKDYFIGNFRFSIKHISLRSKNKD